MLVFLVLCSGLPAMAASYRSVLKKWTRHDEVYRWDNLESRLQWHATYLGPEFREARRARLRQIYEWTDAEMKQEEKKDQEELKRFDDFFVILYSGSSSSAEVGRDVSSWRILLEVPGQAPEPALKFSSVRVTELERTLYPFLDKWSKAYQVRFPKMISGNSGFRLRFPEIPAPSELVWK